MYGFLLTFIRRPVFACMVILGLVVVGAAAFTDLGIDRFPSVDMPTVSIRTTLAGASPEEMESEVSREIEEVVNTVDGIDELRSISRAGGSAVVVTFKLNRDIDSAAQDVRDRVAIVERRLSDDVDAPTVSKFDNDSAPVLTMALAGERTLRELTEIADKVVKVQLERSAGVGEVSIVGGAERTINIDINADRLTALGLPITSVRDAVERQNAEVPGGNLTGSSSEQSLRTLGRLETAEQFAQIVIAEVQGAPVRLRDVATIEDGVAEQRTVARLNGTQAVSLQVRRQSGANTIAVIEAVKENLSRVSGQLPPGVTLHLIRDQSGFIYAALHEIEMHLIMGSILACLVVLAFTRSWRSTVIAGIAIPASVVSTFGMMWLLDFTLNSVTMLALVLMVGIVIDDAIVVLENIFRFIEEKGMSPMDAALRGTGEIALAVLATTLSLAIIFVPVSFMSSISGRFLFQFGITAAVAVMVSLLVSFVLTPTLSARMLAGDAERARKHAGGSRSGFYHVLEATYMALLRFVLRFRIVTAILAIGIMLCSVPLFKMVPQGFLPQGADEAEFEVSLEAPQSISFPAMNDVLRQLEKDLRAIPRIGEIFAEIGGGFLGGVNTANVHVSIAPHEERYWTFGRIWHGLLKGDPLAAFRGNYTQDDVMQEVRKLTRTYVARNVRFRVNNYTGFNVGGGNFDIDLSIAGPDLNQIAAYADQIAARAEEIGGIINVNTSLKMDKPEVRVRIDRERAADLGVSSRDLGTALQLMVGGAQEVTRFRDPETNENYDVRMRLNPEQRSRSDAVSNLRLIGADGRLVEIENLAKVTYEQTAARIDRVDRRRDGRVRGTIAPGYALADRTAALLAEVEKLDMGPGYTVSVRGKGREFEKTYHEFIFAFLLSILFMYMILASQYENLLHPITILLSLPLSVPFALLSLWLSQEQLNLYSALGILVLFGVVKKNSILQVDHMNQLRAGGLPRQQAVLDGCRDRLRPILMTTLCLIFGMLPLWLGTGPGAEERRAVAVVVIGGQLFSLLLTLLVTPVFYTLMDDLFPRLARAGIQASAHFGGIAPEPLGAGDSPPEISGATGPAHPVPLRSSPHD